MSPEMRLSSDSTHVKAPSMASVTAALELVRQLSALPEEEVRLTSRRGLRGGETSVSALMFAELVGARLPSAEFKVTRVRTGLPRPCRILGKRRA